MKQIFRRYSALQWRWAFYDWANSSYALVITSTIFPIYFLNMTKANDGLVQIGSWTVKNSALFSFTLSAAFLFVVLIAPFLATYCDYHIKRKLGMKALAIIGGLSCMSMFFFDEKSVGLGILCLFISTVSYSLGILFYNSFLPNIASEEKQDEVSALGFAMGFLGSVILQLFIFLLLFQHKTFGITELLSIKLGFICVGTWWMMFGLYASFGMPEKNEKLNSSFEIDWKFYLLRFKNTCREIFIHKNLKYYIFTYFLYTTALQTVMFLATLFGKETIGMKDDELIITVFLIQLLGILGAYLASFLSKKISNFGAIFFLILSWIVICLYVYFFVYTSFDFFIAAICVGMVMGGLQALSRATFSKLLPESKERSTQFLFFDLTEKLAIVFGTLIFAWVVQLTGDLRMALLPIVLFFVLSGFCMLALILLNSNSRKESN